MISPQIAQSKPVKRKISRRTTVVLLNLVELRWRPQGSPLRSHKSHAACSGVVATARVARLPHTPKSDTHPRRLSHSMISSLWSLEARSRRKRLGCVSQTFGNAGLQEL